MRTEDVATLGALGSGSHVCWVVPDDATYLRWAEELLYGAAPLREKPVLFGPEGSRALQLLGHLAVQVADPRVAFLAGGPLDPEAMYSMFHDQADFARAEGYERLRVVADMDWLLPAGPSTEEIVGFELLLDRHARDLDATIVCAYRRDSFDVRAISGAACVHPVEVGSEAPAQFRLIAGTEGSWQLTGEVDIAVAEEFAAAISAASNGGDIDASDLEFMDVASMNALASAARRSGRPISVVGAPAMLRRSWRLARFDEAAPRVAFLV